MHPDTYTLSTQTPIPIRLDLGLREGNEGLR